MLFSSCTYKNTLDWNLLIKEYASKAADSIKLEAIYFLKANTQHMTSEIVGLENVNDGSKIYLKDLAEKNVGKDSLEKLILSDDYKIFRYDIKDTELLTNPQIKKDLLLAFDAWKQNGGDKAIPKEIFFNYLLPYKIFREYPSDWRKELSESMHEDYVRWGVGLKPNAAHDTMYQLVNEFVIPQHKKWYSYSLNSLKLGSVPSYDEIRILKNGDCFNEAAINVYLLKAAGIPAGYDVIPYWGSANGSHATAVFWHSRKKKMLPMFPLWNKPSKVFRRTFKNYKYYTNHIKPMVRDVSFAISFLKNDYLLDVTNEYNETSDIVLSVPQVPGLENTKFAYLSVLDYGKWKPIFWSPVKKRQLRFKQMGRNVIYRLEIHGRNDYRYLGRPFLLNNNGILIYPEIFNTITELKLTTINSGENSWVKNGRMYDLSYMNAHGEFIKLKRQICLTDSLTVFRTVPKATFYRLTESRKLNQLSRIFSFKEGKQVWY